MRKKTRLHRNNDLLTQSLNFLDFPLPAEFFTHGQQKDHM